jgi:nicotinamide mononucleotide (NMN) deamidase PncC
MLLSPEQLVQQIHDSPTRIVLAAAGGGSRAIADLLEVPGGSRTLLEAVVPYSAPAMIAWLGAAPDESCSAATARAMAVVAFHRARRYDPPEATPAGVACTAGLATDRPKRGEHRIHVALQTAAMTAAWRLQLQKGRRTREEEERLAGRLLLNVVAAACNVAERLHLDLLEGERVEESRTQAPPAWQDLFLGRAESIAVVGDQRIAAQMADAANLQIPKSPNCQIPVFPGAFNPMHVGHRRMVEIAQETLGRPVALEISIENVDKLPLDYMEIERRLGQFPPEQTVYLTRAATFEEKSRLFAGATFVVGVDTLERIAAPQYYGDSASARQSAVERIAGRGCRFLVFGRALGDNFIRLNDLDLPDSLRALCREVPPEVFREDVSSTALRQSGS